jgi:hypothetical protein
MVTPKNQKKPQKRAETPTIQNGTGKLAKPGAYTETAKRPIATSGESSQAFLERMSNMSARDVSTLTQEEFQRLLELAGANASSEESNSADYRQLEESNRVEAAYALETAMVHYEHIYDAYGTEEPIRRAFDYLMTASEETGYVRPEATTRNGFRDEHARLGDILEYVGSMPPKTSFAVGLENPHSNRGDYSEVGFEAGPSMTAQELFEVLASTMGRSFRGWKGGDYIMVSDTKAHFSIAGETGTRLTLDNIEALRLGVSLPHD